MGKTRTKIVGLEEEIHEKEESKVVRTKVKKKKHLAKGRIYINAKFNNILVTLTDNKGNVLAWSSAGHVGLKNTKKGTPFAGTRAMEVLLEKMKNFSIDELEVYVKGIGPGRETALRVLFSQDYNIVKIEDITPVPFGGPTKPKPRRV